ncbi:hypothetical protein A3J20_05130 [Candidatus Gottesmanbacteria bacterium RIFCSPLOWO2_02_FULL_42_29]|uniref:Dockerin domain-containing protein n=2 Tax=Candidatus Gottesmaniibacteriota TaxID=1752720 RepID=A0A1F6BH84_9BACT|nr:MAG: hypothetical protein UV09_C0016G0003 [Candidatus Gottesmanbacteria bacterium GW2011_GWA2_42_18]KKS76194.1 MAG: hypothetical protein UV46_C0007G0020 [Candidatus Gottesmanbacteria bacterium GW2011_GWC2_42_8]OGG11100.1 MAG: hypothetical protein A2781_00060 [Candidatus Gottesmanbacteria bacterium RIFCSPHIGHO2_01_FULL_42_27]OGG21192.1 MAG: hypothetical protein A3E72_03800 [Candidatus Gottesmanbacteria bacterium RIFCSPHIGHO2_12_FULL_43_26]OGG33937.1 MAG: hypothetical protein A3G68_00220 [Cand
MRKIKRRKRIKHLPVKRYILLVILMMVIANAGVAITVRLLTFSQTCFTKAQVAADSRCLYIWDNKVFEKGTRSSPHKGHPCGMDVSSLIPSFHTADMARYLDPNYKGTICPAAPTATVTPRPTLPLSLTPLPPASPTKAIAASATPSPAASLTPTVTIVAATMTPIPTLAVSPTLAIGCQGGRITADCYSVWVQEYSGVVSTKLTDFNADGLVDLVDFEIWRRYQLK